MAIIALNYHIVEILEINAIVERTRAALRHELARQQYLSAIDVLCGMGLLAPVRVDDWRKGRIDFLERVIQGNLHKISSSMAIFRRCAAEKGLKSSETGYVRHTQRVTVALQFSKSGDPKVEKSCSTHYVSPALGEQKLRKLQEKLERAPHPVVFEILCDSECSECGAEIEQGSLLSKEGEQALCLSCSHFDDLEYLPSGKVDWVLALDLAEAGSLVQSRITRTLDRVQEKFQGATPERFVRINGRGMREKSRRVVAEFLTRHPKAKRILIAAHTDMSALGALEAARGPLASDR